MNDVQLKELTATHVMGWRLVINDGTGNRFFYKENGSAIRYEQWNPSSDFNDALKIVDKLKGKSEFDLYWYECRWSCYFHNTEVIYADTAQYAICLAALKSVGVEI